MMVPFRRGREGPYGDAQGLGLLRQELVAVRLRLVSQQQHLAAVVLLVELGHGHGLGLSLVRVDVLRASLLHIGQGALSQRGAHGA